MTAAALPLPRPRAAASTALYVSPALDTWLTDRPEWFARDLQINDTCYRRLDPEYFVWLRSKMLLAKQAAEGGHLDSTAFDELRTRFNAIQEWAKAAFGEAALLEAIRDLNEADYRPPAPDAPPSRDGTGSRPVVSDAHHEALERARGLVDQIRDQALGLGWTLESLYRSDGFQRRSFAAKSGLVCYIGPNDRLGEVTRQSIEIIGPPPVEVRQRFYNPDVEQPWIVRIGSREKVNLGIYTLALFRVCLR
jgi:hypothetical protein